MRYKLTDPRFDDPAGVMAHKDKHKGGRALIILGGYSAAGWHELSKRIKPDVLLGANGVNSEVPDLDYWICAENLGPTSKTAKTGDGDAIAIMDMFHRKAGAKVKLVSHRSWSLLKDNNNCISIRRQGLELNEMDGFSFREYGQGFLAGWVLKHKGVGALVNVGTVGVQLLHMAGILGCSEIHTVGFDLMFRDKEHHHFYKYPVYKIDKYRNPEMFVAYRGIPTTWTWMESAFYLKAIEPLLAREGIHWVDHSHGLLSLEELQCTKI